jgi:glycosyltransferase involved in cell wall biosynthesis
VEVGDVDALADALIDLLTDAPRRKAMGIEARRAAAEKFSAEVIVPRVEALWREILSDTPEHAAPTG